MSSPNPPGPDQRIVQNVKDALMVAIHELMISGKADVAMYAEQMATDAVYALSTGDEELIHEVHHQAKALAEVQRLRVVNGQWKLLGDIVIGVAKAAVSSAIA